MKINELITEIDYADELGKLTISDEELYVNSVVCDDGIDGREVRLFQKDNQQIYFFVDNKISAFIFLVNGELKGIKNLSGEGGLVTALITFVAHKLKQRIIISDIEGLTKQGINWLVSLLKVGGRGLTIRDQDGKYPNSTKIYDEWITAKNSGMPGPTSIIIESYMTRKFRSLEETKQLLIYTTWVIGSKDLL